MKKSAWQKLSSGEFWQPEKAGQEFIGKITGQHVGETKFGEKPFVEITDTNTGESIAIISASVKSRRLNTCPIGSMIRLVYNGDVVALIGGKKKKVADIDVFAANGVKFAEDWTGGKYYGKPKKQKSKKVKKSA